MSNEVGLARVLERLTPAVRSATSGGDVAVASFAAPVLAAAYASEREHSVVVVATSAQAEQVGDAMSSFLEDVVVWPAWDINPMERVSPDVHVMGRRHELRWRIMSDRAPRVVVTSVRALTQITAPGALVAPIVVSKGDPVDRDEVLSALVHLGYRREPAVEHRGEFAVRGGIIDVWSAHADEPQRIDLFGDEIERLTTFDISDQRSLREVETVEIFAAREWILDGAERERAEALSSFHSWGREIFQRLADGVAFDGMEGWLPWLSTDAHCLLADYESPPTLIVLEKNSVEGRSRDVREEESELALAVGATWGVDLAVPLLHLELDEVITAPWDLMINSLPTSSSSVVLDVTSPPVVQGDPTRIATHVRDWSPQRRGVIVTGTSAAAERVATMLRQEGVDVTTNPAAVLDVRISVVAAPLPQGFSFDNPELVVWSESDLTGRRSVHRAPRARTRNVDGFFNGLAIGSYVVHRQHGVARFTGSTTRDINGTTRDYLILEFKDGRSYWPTEQIEALTPYSGSDAPTLSKMGSEQWQKTRAKARAAAYLVAQELVELYRQRITAPGHAFSPDTPWQHEMESLFAFTETPDQMRAIEEVKADMEMDRPMDRLVCADVGFGKTEIAVRAVFKAVQDNKQAAILVPTTLLASQHLATMTDRFAGFPVKVALLSRFVDAHEVAQTIAGLKDGTIDVVVGTHRLLDEKIVFKDLGLLVVDEEQRFGVNHKEAIKKRAVGVDILTLSASPIPRTLEMAFAGIRELSMVQTPPSERRPIMTHVGEYDEAAVVEALRRELLREGQAFFVHNRVSDIDEVAKRLGRLVPDARIAVAHGQMDEGTLERIVLDFWERRYDVLVCTTIVESGIDMPSVNTLIVDRADALGLGQLHQLRGRVGRGGARAYAYLFYPQDRVLSETAYERLRTIGDNTALGSGFKIAMRDLEIRGAGNLLGHHQSGPVSAVGYDLYVQLVAEAVADAKGIVPSDVATVTIDVPGAAHLPEHYVAADDDRLEAYRRLSTVRTMADLDDVRDEWLDRYGPLPAPAQGLLALSEVRVECLRTGVSEAALLPAKVGIRSRALVRMSPVVLGPSAQMRCRRLYGSSAYDEVLRQLKIELPGPTGTPADLVAILREFLPAASEADELTR